MKVSDRLQILQDNPSVADSDGIDGQAFVRIGADGRMGQLHAGWKRLGGE